MECVDNLRHNLSKMMSDRGLNSSSLARMSARHEKISQRAINDIVNPLSNRTPTLKTVDAIAKTLNVTPKDLFTEPGADIVDSMSDEDVLKKALDLLFEAELISQGDYVLIGENSSLIGHAMALVKESAINSNEKGVFKLIASLFKVKKD